MKALVLCSGGMDSTTLLAMAVKEHGKEHVMTLSIRYGQKHSKELDASQAVSGHFGVEQVFLDMEEIFLYSNSSLLAHSPAEIPHGSYGSQKGPDGKKIVSTYVPFRNGMFLSAGAGVALSAGCALLYFGAHRDDRGGSAYPDCSPAFTKAMDLAIYEGSGGQLQVKAPFIEWSKAEILKYGLELAVPYELTWSCYEGEEKPCGNCATCIDRRNAFTENNAADPLLKEYG